MITFNIIGAGALGQTFGYLLVQQRLARLLGIVNRTTKSGQQALTFIGEGHLFNSVKELPAATFFLISVPDQFIEPVAQELALNPNLEPGTIIIHFSGALSSVVLSSLQNRGCWVASLHPAMSFKNPHLAVTQFKKIPCALEGDNAAFSLIEEVFTAIGAEIYTIPTQHKVMYHIAAVFGTNYLIPVLQQGYDCFLAAGLSQQRAHAVLNALLHSTMQNVALVTEPKLALTGPIQRGDSNTLSIHLQTVTEPTLRQFYSFLAQKTLALSSINEEEKQQLTILFNSV